MSEFSFWTTKIENAITGYITNNFDSVILSNYPDLQFVTDEEELATATFPIVKLTLLPMSEVGADLKNTLINAVRVTYEVQVFCKTSKDDANIIIWEILQLLKDKSFTIQPMPQTVKEDLMYRSVMRASRVIGGGNIDTLFQ